MLPNTRYKRLPHHKYDVNGFGLLKMTALYGANAAGKSNLVNAISLLKQIITEEKLPPRFSDKQFKFRDNEHEDQIIAIEFFQDEVPYYYALKINKGIIKTEELYISGLGRKEDELIFERNTGNKGKTRITFFKEFEKINANRVLKFVIEKNLAKPNKPILKLLTTFENNLLETINAPLEWIESTLEIINTYSRPDLLPHIIDIDEKFKLDFLEVLKNLNLGISGVQVVKKKLKDVVDDEDYLEELLDIMDESSDNMIVFEDDNDNPILAVKENGKAVVKTINLEHTNQNKRILFDSEEESEGTLRLVDLIPAIFDAIYSGRTFIIDEIEKSLHPLIIKELIRKFSDEKNTNGQLIFTTHESNLLDQDIFRQDEIWFAEKDKDGCTDLYSLSDYKEHNTIDIRKGYLMGRYGAIPFLGNLKDLNWHTYDTEKQTV